MITYMKLWITYCNKQNLKFLFKSVIQLIKF